MSSIKDNIIPIFYKIENIIAVLFVLITGLVFAFDYLDKSVNIEITRQVTEIVKSVDILIVGYFFGSSKGSKDKDDTLSNLLNK